jgi:UDP-2,3-diacylglucosamine hydrolase
LIRETLFISDLHLDPGRGEITELFLDFLRTGARQAEALYILGDLFEAWVGDDDDSEHHHTIVEALSDLTGHHVPVYLMHGNRDFLIGEQFEHLSGCTLIQDPTIIDLHGTKTLLMHGDTLCTDDVDYQKFRSLVRDPHWRGQFLSKSLAERYAIADALRKKSQAATSEKAQAIMDVNQQAVEQTFREYEVPQLIHGHTHRPAVHEFSVDGKPVRRIVLGDWYEQGSLLRCNDSGCHLENLSVSDRG